MRSLIIIFTVLPSLLMAQLNGPEAVDHDPQSDLYYISNKSGGNILVGPAGGPYSVFTSNVSSPHGIEVVADTVYVCDGNAIKAFQIPGGTPVNTYNISGATFLNGLTSDRIGMLWFTDFTTSRVHSLDLSTGIDDVIIGSTGTTPNGVIYDQTNVRLIIVNWGNNAPILEWDLLSGFLSFAAQNTGLNNCDGVALGCDGQFYVSSWGAGAIHTFSNDFSSGPTLFVNGLSQPSDIHYNQMADTVVSPNFGSSTVTYHDEPCLGTGIEELEVRKINAWPNPGNGVIQFENGMNGFQYEAYDIKGGSVASGIVTDNLIDISDLPDGSYSIVFRSEDLSIEQRLMYIRTIN